jgi:hypothetical protein
MRPLTTGVFASVILASCMSTNAAVVDANVKLAPICADGVALFTSADRVGNEYQEIAILNSRGDTDWTSEQGMFQSQKRKAASLGANGIIVNNIREPNAGTYIIGALVGTGTVRTGSSLAVYVPSDSLRVRTACLGKSPQT